MSIFSYIFLISLMMIVSLIASLLGIGGGSIFTPIQILFNIGIHQSATNSLFLILIVSLSASLVYLKGRKIDWKLTIPLAIFSVIGGFVGGYLSDFIPEEPILIMLVVVVVISGSFMLIGSGKAEKKEGRSNLPIITLSGLVAGFLSGLLGIGGGVVIVPLLTVLLRFPVAKAISSSSFAIFLASASGFLGHFTVGHWNWHQSLIMAPFVFFGANLGARRMLKTREVHIRRVFGTVMFAIAISLLIKNFF